MNIKDLVSYTRVIETRRPLVIPDVREFPGWASLPGNEWVRSHIKAPIIIDEKVAGVINLHNITPGFYNDGHAQILQTFANQVAIALRNSMLFEEVQNLATIDELTSLYNRRGFFEMCRREVGRLQRFGRSFSVLFVDIDHFKQFNDRYSYEVGDRVLQQVAETLQRNLREIDIVGRYGGEEMIALLPEIDQTKAIEIAERLREIIEALPLSYDQANLTITVSIGVATLNPIHGRAILRSAERQKNMLEKLISEAGEALHVAKRQGRNQVVAY